jgi:hypothetical protein
VWETGDVYWAWATTYAFYAFYAWWVYFPQSGALAEGPSRSRSRSRPKSRYTSLGNNEGLGEVKDQSQSMRSMRFAKSGGQSRPAVPCTDLAGNSSLKVVQLRVLGHDTRKSLKCQGGGFHVHAREMLFTLSLCARWRIQEAKIKMP